MSSLTFGFGDSCLPTRVPVAPSGARWVHEIKHDGYRLMLRRTPSGARIKTRNGYDWTDRFDWVVEPAQRLRATRFVIDGEGVILRADGVSDFDQLHDRRHVAEARTPCCPLTTSPIWPTASIDSGSRAASGRPWRGMRERRSSGSGKVCRSGGGSCGAAAQGFGE